MFEVWTRDINTFLEEHLPDRPISDVGCHFISATKAMKGKQSSISDQCEYIDVCTCSEYFQRSLRGVS